MPKHITKKILIIVLLGIPALQLIRIMVGYSSCQTWYEKTGSEMRMGQYIIDMQNIDYDMLSASYKSIITKDAYLNLTSSGLLGFYSLINSIKPNKLASIFARPVSSKSVTGGYLEVDNQLLYVLYEFKMMPDLITAKPVIMSFNIFLVPVNNIDENIPWDDLVLA